MSDKTTAPGLRRMKARGEKIVMATCYDYATALLLDSAGIDCLLVGDSVGNNVLGFENTVPVTMEVMLHHTRAVRRGTKHALLLADMPFLSYQVTQDEAVRNAGRLVQEAGAEAVKLEGGEPIVATIARLTAIGIPVVGHLGLTPQSIHKLGGYRTQGRNDRAAEAILNDAVCLDQAGVSAIVLELIPIDLAKKISETVGAPTIGIGAGPHCDGQVQVLHDLMGLFPDKQFRHSKRYTDAGKQIVEAAQRYAAEVRGGEFPTKEHTY